MCRALGDGATPALGVGLLDGAHLLVGLGVLDGNYRGGLGLHGRRRRLNKNT